MLEVALAVKDNVSIAAAAAAAAAAEEEEAVAEATAVAVITGCMDGVPGLSCLDMLPASAAVAAVAMATTSATEMM